MKTLHLVLKSKWYDKIASGEKTSEYRECKPYWNKRFTDTYHHPSGKPIAPTEPVHKVVIFHRGYTAQTMKFQINSIVITDKPNDLGLDTCWEIKLGQRIK